MKLEYQGKSLEYNLDGSLKGTAITLGHLDGGYLPILLQGDQTALSNQELFDLAMEQLYQENFPQRAEKELFATLTEKIEQIEEEALSTERLGKNKETYLNQLVKTSESVMAAQGTLRQVKKAGNQFTNDQLFEVINTISVASFQAVDLLRNVITILK